MKKAFSFKHNLSSFIDGFEEVQNPEEADLIIFPGGADVSPSLYKEDPHPFTGFSDSTDKLHQSVFKEYVGKVPMLGICRGSQFLSVMNGASLVQHMKHPYWHLMATYDGKILTVNSTHHQQIYLRNLNKQTYKLLGFTPNKISPIHENGNSEDYHFAATYREPEVVYFGQTNCLCMQYHPELMDISQNREAIEWSNNVINQYLFENVTV
jgi:GMP synthase-like glutamine amidotransferase